MEHFRHVKIFKIKRISQELKKDSVYEIFFDLIDRYLWIFQIYGFRESCLKMNLRIDAENKKKSPFMFDKKSDFEYYNTRRRSLKEENRINEDWTISMIVGCVHKILTFSFYYYNVIGNDIAVDLGFFNNRDMIYLCEDRMPIASSDMDELIFLFLLIKRENDSLRSFL